MYCECGCGQITKIATRTSRKEGIKKGEYKRFIRWHHTTNMPTGEKSHNWRGGVISERGYIKIMTKQGINPYTYEHVLVMEKFLGRKLSPKEKVHHINEVGSDNRIENLLLVTEEEHRIIHSMNNLIKENGTTLQKKCRRCGKYDNPHNLNRNSMHKACENEYKKEMRKKTGKQYIQAKKKCLDCPKLINTKYTRCNSCAQKERQRAEKDRRLGL